MLAFDRALVADRRDDETRELGFSASNPHNQYFLWAATAYGLIEKDDNDQYRLTEIARKILAPTYEDERREGIIKAIAKPAILGRFCNAQSLRMSVYELRHEALFPAHHQQQ